MSLPARQDTETDTGSGEDLDGGAVEDILFGWFRKKYVVSGLPRLMINKTSRLFIAVRSLSFALGSFSIR